MQVLLKIGYPKEKVWILRLRPQVKKRCFLSFKMIDISFWYDKLTLVKSFINDIGG